VTTTDAAADHPASDVLDGAAIDFEVQPSDYRHW